jgi:hypothetical protein
MAISPAARFRQMNLPSREPLHPRHPGGDCSQLPPDAAMVRLLSGQFGPLEGGRRFLIGLPVPLASSPQAEV